MGGSTRVIEHLAILPRRGTRRLGKFIVPDVYSPRGGNYTGFVPRAPPAQKPTFRLLWAVIVIVVALIVTLAAVAVVLTHVLGLRGPSYLTMTQYYDLGTGGTNGPTNWHSLAVGTEIRVQDRIVDVYTSFGPLVFLSFPYTGSKFITNFSGATSPDNFCHYGTGDVVRLVGTIEQGTPDYRGVFFWNIEGGSPPTPVVSFGSRVVVGAEVRVPIAFASDPCRPLHFRGQLWQNGAAVDGAFLRYDGIRGIHLRYDDTDRSGTLNAADVIAIMDPPSGSLEFHLYFKDALVDSVAWMSP